MRVLVVDDEPPARRRLVRMLAEIDGVEVAGEAGDGLEALETIDRDRPDVVLLDIRMPGLDGLSLAASGRDLPPIIFTTAYDEHAVEAFEVEAVDYLLKPVKAERLERALARVRQQGGAVDGARIEALLSKIARQTAAVETPRISARSSGTTRLFEPHEIVRFRASEKYVVFQKDGREYVLDDTLNALEERLAEYGFFRCHRSELVNLRHVRAVRTEGGITRVGLSDGQAADVARRELPELKRRLGID